MSRFLIPLLLLVLASPAGALQFIVWDRDFQTKVGYGESSGGKFNVQLLPRYSGPVVVLFSQTDEERRRATFPTLLSRYDGFLRGGQLIIETPGNDDVTLSKFLATFRLSVSVQSTGQTLTLPGLKVAGPDNIKINNK
ncbi:hypothetical protein GCM10008955_37490 [Deinococcus malanensis]|uniref:Uncharacterized protein n=1 Tax=Deinococcus malanensis TaxID=1706855 RepID=A0ABQ2F4L8_9DEIO|nr:hypothetical protein [Deinococcus malanensis]GGK40235.1 hypothetical protein GCM10008955_37490 [Deinococcus malanensis]